ncbi:hypothetical protein A7982_12269 [Minicystis rosea]|nr:hypothetical protein A7982_12269 [Minicystis rosea]
MAAGDEGLEKAADAAGESSAAAHDAVPGTPGERSKLAEELRVGRAPPTLLAVFIAWATTLAPAGFSRGSPIGAGLLSVLALAAGLGGPILARRNARAGRHLGISLFVALAVATWLLGAQAIHPLRLDSVRGVFGAIAWGVFALSWSDRWGPGPEAIPADPEAPLLLPRAALPLGAVPITALAVAAALGYLVLAFRVRDPDRALLAQAVALACAVGMVTAAGVVATARDKRRASTGRRLTPPVVRALLLLCAVAVGGAVFTALRR